LSKGLKIALTSIVLALSLITVAVVAVFALLNSQSGSAFVASTLTSQLNQSLDGHIQFQDMSGSLTGPLQLDNLQVSLPGTELAIDSITLNWQPSALLRGQVVLTQLQVDGVNLDLSATDPTEDSTAFSPESLQLPVDIIASGIVLRNLNIRQEGQDSQRIYAANLDISLKGDLLALKHVQVNAPQGAIVITGQTRLRNQMPLDFLVDWTWNADESAPLSGNFALQGDTDWSDGIGFDLSYKLEANGLSSLDSSLPTREQISGIFRGALADEDLQIDQLTAAFEDSAINLGIQGKFTALNTNSPELNTRLTWEGLRWPLLSPVPDISSPEGTLNIRGPLEGYELLVETQVVGVDIPAGHWQLQGTGNLEQLQLAELKGQLLGGEINLRGETRWEPLPRWQLSLEGRTLDIGQLMPDLPGQLDLRASTNGQLHPEEGIQAQVTVESVSGTLLDYPLALNADLNIAGETASLSHLQLDSGQNQVRASGRASAEALDLDWQVRALNPGELYPGAAGTLIGQGQVSGTPEAPRINGRLRGEQLSLDGLSVPALEAAFNVSTDPEGELTLSIKSGPVTDGEEELLTSMALRIGGSNQSHQISLQAKSADQQLNTELSGGLSSELDAWQGQIASLRAQSNPFGQWSLEEAARLALAADSASLEQSCFSSTDTSGQLCAGGDWKAAGDSTLAIRLKDLPVALLVPSVGGELAGQLQASLAANGQIRATGDFDMSPGQIDLTPAPDSQALAHGGGNLQLRIDDKGLDSQLVFNTPENGRVDAKLRMPALTSLPLAETQALRGRVQAEIPDLSGAAAWVDEIAASTGWMKADLALAGSLERPSVTGVLELREASADIPMAGLQIQGLELEVRSDPKRTDVLEVRGGLRSGPGQLSLSGNINAVEGSANLALKGDDLEIYNTRDARVALSPNIQLQWLQDTLTLRGDVLIPSADITPKLELNPAMMSEDGEVSSAPGQLIAPSTDVVVISGSLESDIVEELTAPFRIDNQTRLILGDAVNVNAVGFMGRLSGDVLFVNTPDQKELIPFARGQLSVEDGTFRSFGQDLDIRTGQLLFNNVPVTEPEINLRAVRWIDNDPQVTSAGILLTGPITTPTMELYSRPQLETSEVQSYLLTGRSTRDRNSVLSIGTYVTPRIYVGYGYNTLEKTSEFNSLFTITPRYGVGLDVGEADNNLNMTFTYER
jgi:translocation and assembly module TamB